MKVQRLIPVLSAFALAMVAGSSLTAQAQYTSSASQKAAMVSPTVDFRTSKWLNGRSVVNGDSEEIATVSDLIVDRGTGRIEYVVIKTGTIFGMGGRAVTIPFRSFRWDTTKERFTLASTIDQLKQFPEYTAESFESMKHSAADEKNALRQRLAADAATAGDPYAGTLNTAARSTVSGEVSKVERVRTSTFGEQVVATIDTGTGGMKRVALGPSWYINGAIAAPMRGDRVVIQTLALPRDPEQLLVASELRNRERDLPLRSSDGSPVWALKSIESGGTSYSTPYSRFLVVSRLPGMKIDCRGNEVGKVQEVIFDRNSGEMGFLSIDPNQNFLGIGDTKRLVPWSVATVALDGTMHLDASKEMVLESPETPTDVSTLNTGTHAESVYKAFAVPAPRFESNPPLSSAMPDAINAWSMQGPIVASMDSTSDRTISGKVSDNVVISFANGIQSARALKIGMVGDTKDVETVLMGPSWYIDNQASLYQVGDPIKLDVTRTMVDGQRYWIAKSVDYRDARVVFIGANTSPAWARP